MANIVYVLTNLAMPGMVKIGMTDRADVQRRMSELYSTGVPLPFECSMAIQVEGRQALDIENALHAAFDPYRVNPSREFFRIESEQAEAILQVLPGIDVTPQIREQDTGIPEEDREAALQYTRRQSRTSEEEFFASLNENGRRLYERVLALGNMGNMLVKWGVKGFSLNVIANGARIVVCYGYPPSAFNQSLYTEFAALRERANVSSETIEELRKEALETGLFVPAGRGENITCRTNQRLEDVQLDVLTSWLRKVIGTIRESSNGPGKN